MTPEEAACKIDHLYQPHGVVLDEDIIDILNQVAATAKHEALIEVAEMWEAVESMQEAGVDEYFDELVAQNKAFAKALRTIAATPQGEKI